CARYNTPYSNYDWYFDVW
nr:immunoglobulin heavy chain junction region [Mus musculus]